MNLILRKAAPRREEPHLTSPQSRGGIRGKQGGLSYSSPCSEGEAGRGFRGFTLIELLVVLTIIGLLAAILLPVFASAREKARQSVCESNLHQIDLGIQMYQADNNGILPDHFFDARAIPADEQAGADRLLPYEHDPDIYHCPDSRIFYKPDDLILDYQYRVYDLLSLEDVNNLPEAIMKADPASVLVYDENHKQGNDTTYIVLRAEGSVSRIDSSKVPFWYIANGKWEKWSRWSLDSSGSTLWPVFPDEPWPPQFEQ